MAGLVAGSAIGRFHEFSARPKLVALTVNNVCNLKCPHCYLQYHGPDGYFPTQFQRELISQPFEHLAIVGMEPFVNVRTAQQTIELAMRARESGKRVSAITNGLGLQHLDPSCYSLFDFIDVSFDGGPKTYEAFRGGSLTRLTRSLDHVRTQNLPLNALHTLCKENLVFIDDMMNVRSFYDFGSVVFSPYVETANHGVNSVNVVGLADILEMLSNSHLFRDDPTAHLLLDSYNLAFESMGRAQIAARIAKLQLVDKVRFIPHTPLQVGSIRVTYDGLIMAPAMALHTSLYHLNPFKLGRVSLARAYERFLAHEQADEASMTAYLAHR